MLTFHILLSNFHWRHVTEELSELERIAQDFQICLEIFLYNFLHVQTLSSKMLQKFPASQFENFQKF